MQELRVIVENWKFDGAPYDNYQPNYKSDYLYCS